jgi:hypothetical protein
MTDFVVVVGPGTVFSKREPASLVDTSDIARKILVVEIARSDIHVLEPRDLDLDTMSFVVNDLNHPSISTTRPGGPVVAFADRSVRALKASTPADTLREWLLLRETSDSADKK